MVGGRDRYRDREKKREREGEGGKEGGREGEGDTREHARTSCLQVLLSVAARGVTW